VTEAYNSGYLVLNRDGTRLYAVSEGMSFMGRASGGVIAYDISEGAPEMINHRFSGGQRPCCIALSEDGGELYCANFFGGTISVFPIEDDGALGEMRRLIKEQPLPGRLDGMHCVEPLPGGEVGAVYLGTGSVIIYDAADFAEKQRFSLENGAFPRHFAVSGDGRALYLLLQTPSELHTALRGEDGIFRVKSVLPATPEGYTGAAEAAAVRLSPNGQLLFASTRIADTVAVCRVDGQTGLPEISDIVSLPVKTPRDICVTPDGRFLLMTGQASDNICIHEIDYAAGTLRLRSVAEGIVSPGCIAVKEA
jgi:6-phosphogluconolactonase